MHVSNDAVKGYRFRIESHETNTVKLIILIILKNLKIIFFYSKKDKTLIRHFYSKKPLEIFKIYKQYLIAYLNDKTFTFSLNLPNGFRNGSKMLHLVNILIEILKKKKLYLIENFC